MRYFFSIVFIFSFFLFASAQEKKDIIQLSGVVVGMDSTMGVPGVHIYVPATGRGTTTNQYGYFSMPTLEGDSIIISAVGYQRQYVIVPFGDSENYTTFIELLEDTTYLSEIEIFPYPTEELFKEAILALQLPDQEQYDNLMKNLDEEMMARMFRSMPMDADMNYRYYMDQQIIYANDKFGPRTNPLLNPFAWAEFIKSIKRGDLKKD